VPSADFTTQKSDASINRLIMSVLVCRNLQFQCFSANTQIICKLRAPTGRRNDLASVEHYQVKLKIEGMAIQAKFNLQKDIQMRPECWRASDAIVCMYFGRKSVFASLLLPKAASGILRAGEPSSSRPNIISRSHSLLRIVDWLSRVFSHAWRAEAGLEIPWLVACVCSITNNANR